MLPVTQLLGILREYNPDFNEWLGSQELRECSKSSGIVHVQKRMAWAVWLLGFNIHQRSRSFPSHWRTLQTRHDFTPQAPVTEETYTKAGKGMVPAIRKYNSWALRTFHAWDYAGTGNDTKGCLSIVCLIFWHVTICWALPNLIRESLGTRLTMFWTPQLYIPLFIAFVLFFWFNCTCNCTFWLHAIFQSSIISEQFNNFQSGLLYCTVFSCMEIMVLSVPLIHPRIIQQKIVIDESHRLFFYPIQRWLGRGTGYTLLKDDQQQLLEDNSS